jgi:hypothetical protein
MSEGAEVLGVRPLAPRLGAEQQIGIEGLFYSFAKSGPG